MQPGNDCGEVVCKRMRVAARVSVQSLVATGGRPESVVGAAVRPGGPGVDAFRTRITRMPAVTGSGHPAANTDAGIPGATAPTAEGPE